eukprot:SM000452S16093  [mRNA]  locus=s452:14327:14769:+ [translate_table: standard]
MLLNHDADIRARDAAGNTPLHCAAASGQLDAAALLVERGADLAANNRGGLTPLQHAALAGHEGVRNYLLDRVATRESDAQLMAAEPSFLGMRDGLLGFFASLVCLLWTWILGAD